MRRGMGEGGDKNLTADGADDADFSLRSLRSLWLRLFFWIEPRSHGGTEEEGEKKFFHYEGHSAAKS